MGYGGNLIWTSVLSAIRKHDGSKPTVCSLPSLSDLVAGCLYDRSQSYEHDVVFCNNPDILFISPTSKSIFEKTLDLILKVFLKAPSLRRTYESWVFKKSEALFLKGGAHYVHVNMQRHSYASHQTRRKTFWKKGRAERAMAEPFNVKSLSPAPKLYFAPEEHARVNLILSKAQLNGHFIVVEPDTNCDWFGDLRAWPMTHWQDVCNSLRQTHPDIPIVQIGMGHLGIIKGAIDLTNKTSFREAALVIKKATLFMGTEGGLMHAARAVNGNAVILWGGITLPEFIGYPDQQITLCQYVDCAPCGNAGWCDQGHKCMLGISVQSVIDAAEMQLK